jgi:putative NADPH-quinone reductase
MKLLVVYCHPVPESYCAALRDAVVDAACTAGHDVDLMDLYAEGFDPAMTARERRDYHTASRNEAPIADDLARLRQCDGLIFVYPTWWFGQPAMLKGWLDRVWVPHATFTMPGDGGGMKPLMRNITLFGVVTTYGSPWWWWRLVMGAPGRKILMRGVRGCCARRCRTFWLGLHNMDRIGHEERAQYVDKVHRRVAAL